MIKLPLKILLLLCFATPLLPQNISHDVVKRGIEAFYMADFEEAMQLLQSAIINEILSDDEEFYAHLYVGFCHVRHNSDMGSAQLYFQRAVQINPDEELDPNKIPPDLYGAYTAVKNAMLGSLVVVSEPSSASIVLVDPSTNNVKRGRTPDVFANLPTNVYQVLVSKSGYDTYSSSVTVQAGLTDSVKVILLETEKSFFMKYWPYGAGALAASAAILAITTARDGNAPPSSTPRETLPNPPQRP